MYTPSYLEPAQSARLVELRRSLDVPILITTDAPLDLSMHTLTGLLDPRKIAAVRATLDAFGAQRLSGLKIEDVRNGLIEGVEVNHGAKRHLVTHLFGPSGQRTTSELSRFSSAGQYVLNNFFEKIANIEPLICESLQLIGLDLQERQVRDEVSKSAEGFEIVTADEKVHSPLGLLVYSQTRVSGPILGGRFSLPISGSEPNQANRSAEKANSIPTFGTSGTL